MATHHRGIGIPLGKDPDHQESDVNIQHEYQADIHDFEKIEPDHQAGIRDLTHEIENYDKLLRPMIMTLWML